MSTSEEVVLLERPAEILPNTEVNKPFICSYCYKRFSRKSYLRNHVRIHLGIKPYECDVCLKRFTESGAMKSHRRIHFNDRPYKCDICDRSFKFISSLKGHKASHLTIRPFQCLYCDKFYKTLKSRRAHMLQFHNEEYLGFEKLYKQLSKVEPPNDSSKTSDKNLTLVESLKSEVKQQSC